MWKRLGIRSFIIYIIKGFLPGLFLIILSFAILWMKNIFAGSMASSTIQLGNIEPIILAVAGTLTVAAFPIMGIGVLINLLHYFSFKYRLDDDYFKYTKGIISVDEITIPYSKIEDVDFDQSVIGRLIGVARLSIITAGREQPGNASETEAIFKMMDVEKARFLQNELLKKGSVQKVKSV